MGVYTKVFFNCDLNIDSDVVIDALDFMFNIYPKDRDREPGNLKLPEHDFFKNEDWYCFLYGFGPEISLRGTKSNFKKGYSWFQLTWLSEPKNLDYDLFYKFWDFIKSIKHDFDKCVGYLWKDVYSSPELITMSCE